MLREHLDKFISIYIDDILVYSRTLEEHVNYVRTVLYALKDYNLRLNPENANSIKNELSSLDTLCRQLDSRSI